MVPPRHTAVQHSSPTVEPRPSLCTKSHEPLTFQQVCFILLLGMDCGAVGLVGPTGMWYIF